MCSDEAGAAHRRGRPHGLRCPLPWRAVEHTCVPEAVTWPPEEDNKDAHSLGQSLSSGLTLKTEDAEWHSLESLRLRLTVKTEDAESRGKKVKSEEVRESKNVSTSVPWLYKECITYEDKFLRATVSVVLEFLIQIKNSGIKRMSLWLLIFPF
ncbi:hypothetical protein U9M48_005436 [Paspalum notatum var. saurae]|uniref:Uncharacterized protein n=1 Tax=Paspalum notatum var. saurae TaxID=547442 RepID=A0AAQ3PQV7_PASNO